MSNHDSKSQRDARRSRIRRCMLHRGQAIIEMALVVTVLLFLTLGLIQYAMLANARITLTNLAREGARFAAVNATRAGSDSGESNVPHGIKRYVKQVAASTPLRDITDADIRITPAEGSIQRTSGQSITVEVSYNMRNKFILPISFPGLARFGTATSTAVMVIE